MRVMMCSVYDSKVGVYAAPFCARSRGEAIRSFHSATLDDNLPFKRYPADYRLFCVGEYDDNVGRLYPAEQPEPIIGADEFGSEHQFNGG